MRGGHTPHRRSLGRASALLLVLAATGCATRPSPADSSLPAGSALRPLIISGFGDWRGSRASQHYGIDIRVRPGTPVLAAADGTVIRIGAERSSGKLVVVAHADDLATVYFHLSAIAVGERQTVRRGETLGRSGMTGNATTPHLHFGVCRRPAGRCGNRIGAGWDNPRAYWVEGDPCFRAGRPYPGTRLTFPVPCPGSA